jgi:hypothetical protein
MALWAQPPALLLQTIENVAAFHREHERFYAAAPREQAIVLQRHARTLHGLADRWSGLRPPRPLVPVPSTSTEDLAERTTVRADGVLYLPGPEEPPELVRIEESLRAMGEESLATAEWMSAAMQASWDAAPVLLDIPALADLLGERHRIIANDWQAAIMNTVVGRLLQRAADFLARIDLSPSALRADLAGEALSPPLLHGAAELVSRAADLLSESAALVHDNERRWRVFHERVAQLLVVYGATPQADS